MSIEHLITDHHEPALGETAMAVFSPCRTYRYMLGRSWNPDRPTACFLMLNPSAADAFQLDPTVRRCIGFSKTWHAGGIVVLNAFGLRATDPKALRSHPDPVGPDNDAVIAGHFAGAGGDAGPTVVAWGVHASLGGRDRQVVDLLRRCGVTPTSLGVTKAGHPRHPLYVPGVTAAVPFELATVTA